MLPLSDVLAPPDHAFLRGGGTCGRLIACHDWSDTLGPIAGWPQSLKTATAILLRSPVPMVMLWGVDGIMIYNDAYTMIAAARHPALLGSPVREGWPEVADFNDNVMKVCLAGGTLAYHDQELMLNRSGAAEQLWFDLDYSPILDEAGRPAGVLAIVTETTERVRAEGRARDSEARLRATIEQMPVGVSLAEIGTGTLVAMNRVGGEIIGDTGLPADVDGYVRWGAIQPDGSTYAADDYPLARAAVRGEAVDREPMLYRRADGRQIRMEVSAAQVHDAAGTPLLAVCTFSDVTERVEAEQQLRDHADRLRRAHEAAGLGWYEWDMAGGGGQQSDSMLRLAGLEPGRAYSLREIVATVHPDDRAVVLQTVEAIGKGAGRIETDYRVVKPDGTIRWLRDIGQLERDADGKPLRWVGIIQDVTERATFESRLRVNEERLRLAATAAQIGTWDLDLVAGTGAWDGEAMRLCGLDGEDPAFDGTSWLRCAHPDERERIAAAFAASLAPDAPPYAVEFRAARPAADGRERWMTSHGVVIRDGAGRAVRAVGIVRDVTARQREMERLRQSEERLLLAQEAGGIGIWDWDIARDEVYWSPGYRAVWGLDPDESASFERVLDRVDAGQRQAARDSLAAAQAAGRPWTAELRTTDAAGEPRFIACRGRFLPGPDGSAERMLGVCFDITERKRIEEALRRSEEQLRMGLSAGRMATWELDVASGEIRFSSNAAELLGEGDTPEAFRARMPPEDAERARAATQRALTVPGTGYAVEFRYRHPDGRELWLENQGIVVRDPAGRPLRAHGVCVDISERKAAERALHGINERLEAEVQRRSAELLQAQDALRQSQKMEALGQLTGGVAHDFNNLLGAVVGSLDLIRRRADDPAKVRRFAEVGLEAADKGARLTGQLLAFSRAQRIEVKPVDMTALVTGMRDLFARTLGPMIEVVLDVCDRAVVLSDATQLELALLNLAINARDAMPDGGRLTIGCRPVAVAADPRLPDGDFIEVSVVDTGVGMSADVVARAFDPFFTTKAVGAGTGLGLSQVHGIVRQSGGDVRIDSRPGSGTTIRLLLPRCTASLAEPGDAAPGPRGRRWAGTALVIDDDAGIRATLSSALELLGFAVTCAADGPEGLARLRADPPTLLIVDYAMPGMTGAEVTARARAEQPDLPVIFCTGHSDSQAIDNAVGAQAVVLRKPFRLDGLEAVVAAVLDSDTAQPGQMLNAAG